MAFSLVLTTRGGQSVRSLLCPWLLWGRVEGCQVWSGLLIGPASCVRDELVLMQQEQGEVALAAQAVLVCHHRICVSKELQEILSFDPLN